MKRSFLFGTMILALPMVALAVDSYANAGDPSFELAPVILDSADGEGATIALEFKVSGTIFSKDLSAKEEGEDFPFGRSGDFQIDYKADVTVAANAERNPKNFLNGLLDANFGYQSELGTFSAGPKYETAQDIDDKQSSYGLRVTYGKREILLKNDVFAIYVLRGEIDPAENETREQAARRRTT